MHPDVTATVAEVINTHAKLGRKVINEGFVLKVYPTNVLDIFVVYLRPLCVKNKLTYFDTFKIAWRSKCRAEYYLDSKLTFRSR